MQHLAFPHESAARRGETPPVHPQGTAPFSFV